MEDTSDMCKGGQVRLLWSGGHWGTLGPHQHGHRTDNPLPMKPRPSRNLEELRHVEKTKERESPRLG